MLGRLNLFGATNLDLGGGKYDLATKYLEGLGVENWIYDPYHQTNDQLSAILARTYHHPTDTGTCFNVLNVIKEIEVRQQALRNLQAMVKPGGLIAIQVHPGDKSGVGKVSQEDCWQENRPLPSYLDEIQSVFPQVRLAYGLAWVTNS